MQLIGDLHASMYERLKLRCIIRALDPAPSRIACHTLQYALVGWLVDGCAASRASWMERNRARAAGRRRRPMKYALWALNFMLAPQSWFSSFARSLACDVKP